MASLISPLLWSFVPAQLTSTLLPHLSARLPALFPAAPPRSPQHAKNYRHCYTLLIVAYLAYTLFQRDAARGEDLYALLGVPRTADDDGLRRAFRTLSRRYHPDRAGEAGGDVFILVRQAYEVLSDPVRRYAYDRFGPDMIAWKCQTVKEYVYDGLFHSVGFYLASAGFMLLLKVTGKATHGSYWRQTLFLLLLALELSLVLSPTPAPDTLPFLAFLSPLAPRSLTRTPQFIWTRRLHRLWASLSVGISQLAGVWAETERPVKEEEAWSRVATLASGIATEAAGQFHDEVAPLLTASSDPIAAQYAMLAGIEQLLLDSTVSSHPAVRPAWQAALSKTRARHSGGIHPHAQRIPLSHLSAAQTLQLAVRTPLPSSPPDSPRPPRRALA